MTKNFLFSLEKIKTDKFITLVQAVLLLWIFSIPLKNALYQITTVLLIVLFFVHLIYYKQKEQLQELWVTYKQLFFLFFAFILTMLLSSFVGISDHKAFSEILKYIYRYPLILFILFYFYKQSYFNRKWLLSVIFIALTIHALDGLYQYITGVDLIQHKSLYNNIRICGAVFNPNPFGLIMAIGTITSLSLFFYFQKVFFFFYGKTILFIFFLIIFIYLILFPITCSMGNVWTFLYWIYNNTLKI
jgi:hypothetical protein